MTHDIEEKREQLNTVSNSFCLAKWSQTTLHLFNGNTQSCHHVLSHRVDSSKLENPAALHNTPEKMSARKKMLEGQRPKECSYCWRLEDRGELSDRTYKSAAQWAWTRFDDVLKSGLGPSIVPSHLEIAFDNVCQFKCAYCSPVYSTAWQAEIKKFGPYPTSTSFNQLSKFDRQGTQPLESSERQKYLDAFWKWWPEIAPHLRHLRVTGGEPFLARDTFRLMREVAANPQPHMIFEVNSNLGLERARFEDVLAQLRDLQMSVKRVEIYTSVDTVGAQAEYVRYGLNYNRFVQNVEFALQTMPSPFALNFMVSINNLSLFGLPKLLEWIRELREKYPHHSIGLDTPYLAHPRFLSVEIMRPTDSVYIDQAIEVMNRGGFSTAEKDRVARVKSLIEASSIPRILKMVLRRDFYKMFSEYDRRRGVDFEATFPEFQDFWKSCKKLAIV